MNRRRNKLWIDFENCLGFKFPKELKAILSISGFDSELSLKEINEKTIESIEQIVNENLSANNLEIVSALKGSVYEKKPLPFHFLLGHKILLSSLPERIDSIKRKKETRRKFTEDSEVIENRGPEEYKKSLLLKLKKYSEKHELNFEIEESQIKKISQINQVTRCVVQCCFCETKIPCTFTTYWRISNLIAHIRGHLQNPSQIPVSLAVNSLINRSSVETSSNLNSNLPQINRPIVSLGSDVLKEVENVV